MKCKEEQKIYKAATNGEQSLLHSNLLDILPNYKDADRIYNMIYSNDFKEMFGDFENESLEDNFTNRLDDNGEPLLITKNTKNPYFLDKYNQKVFYLKDKQGLSKLISKSDVTSYANSLASSYFLDNLEIDKETFAINNLKEGQNLNDFIKRQLEIDFERLQNSDDFLENDLGFALEDSIDYIDEWKEEIKIVFSTIKVDIKNIEEAADFVKQEEEFRGELMRKESFLKSSKDNVNNNIKLMLSLIPSTEENVFGKTELVKFFDIYTSISNELRGIESLENEDMYDLFVDKIENMANAKPYLYYLLENYLQNPKYLNENFKNKFVNAFTLYKNNFLMSEIVKDEKSLNYSVKNISEVGSRRNHIIKEWNFNLSQKSKNPKEFINELAITQKAISKIDTEKDFKSFLKNSVLYEMKDLGININNKELNLFLDNQNFQEQDFETRKRNLLTLYSSLQRSLGSSNLYDDQQTLKRLADAKAFFIDNISDASLYTMNKNKWINSLPSHLDKTVGLWKKDYNILQELYNENDNIQSTSYYLKYLLGYINNNNTPTNLSEEKRIELAKERIENIEIGIFNSIQEKNNLQNSVDNKGVKELDAKVDYINKALALQKDYQKTALAADKNTERQIHYGTKIFTNARKRKKDGKIKVSKAIEDIVFGYVNGEYKRAMVTNNEIEAANGDNSNLTPNYHTNTQNGKKIFTMPELSIDINSVGKVILPSLENQIYDSKTGKPLFTDLKNKPEIEQEIKVKIRNFLSNEIKNTYRKLVEDGIIYNDSNNLVQNNFLSDDINSHYLKENGDQAYINVAADLFVNGFISQVEYTKLFTGDIAYYKNIADYKKRVFETYTDGQYLNRLSEDEKYMNISIFDSIEQEPFNMEDIPEELQKVYSNTNATDAQAYITPQRWRFLLEKLGKWNSTFDKTYEKILEGDTDFTTEEIQSMQPLKGVYFYRDKSNKPIFLKYSQAVLVPGAIKDTQLESIYNKMIKDSQGNTLEYKDQIHELIAKDGIKVGAITPSTIHNEDGSLMQEFSLNKMSIPNRGWKLQQDLPTKGYKATNVGSQIQKIIFQGLSKYVSEDSNVKFDYQGEEVSAIEMANIINDIVSSMSNSMFKKFKNKYGINDNNNIENKESLINSLVSQLKERKAPKNIINALESNISPAAVPGQYQLFQNVFSSEVNKSSIKIKTNGAGFIQMSDFGINYTDAISTKGIRFTPKFKSTVEKGKYSSTKLHMPKIIETENGKKIIQGGGIFLPSGFISKYIANWRDYTDKELFGEYDKKTRKYKGGLIPQEALENIIGYRIPNQGLASNDNFEIAGILPKTMGDTAIPYVGLTTKTGSDFDIDKLYLMIPTLTPVYLKRKKIGEYIKNNLKGKTIQDTINNMNSILDSIDDDEFNQDIDVNILSKSLFDDKNIENLKFVNNKLIEAILKSDSELSLYIKESIPNITEVESLRYDNTKKENQLIEAYKAVLTNVEVYKDLINPIDIDYIKNDALALKSFSGISADSAFNSIEDIVTKLKFMQGKAGLGQAVNQLVDFVRGTIDPVGLNVNNEILKGLKRHVNSNNDKLIELDKINSKNLTDVELKEYVKFINENSDKSKKITFKEAKKTLKSVEIKDSLTALVNAFVDIAKDSYIIDVNWTTNTNNVAFMLLRMGMHPFKINSFLSQQGLKEYIKFKSDKESNIVGDKTFIENKFKSKLIKDSIKDEFGQKVFKIENYNLESIFEDLINESNYISKYKSEKGFKILDSKLKKSIKKEFKKTIEIPQYNEILNTIYQNIVYSKDTGKIKQNFNLTDLRENIKSSNFFNKIDTLNTFLTLDKGAKLLNESINATKFDVSGKGKDNASLLFALNNINELLNKPYTTNFEFSFNGFPNKIKNTFLKSYFKNSLYEPFEIIKKSSELFPTLTNNAVNSFFTLLNVSTNNNLRLINEKTLNDLQKDYYTYMFKDFKPLQSTTEEKANILKELPKTLNNLKTKYPNNFLLDNLYSEEGSDKGMFFIKASPSKKDENLINNINDDFNSLREIEPEFINDLVKYSYITSGFNNKLSSFNDFISYEWFLSNNLNQHISKFTKNKNTENFEEEFINKYIENNLNSLNKEYKLKSGEYMFSKTIIANIDGKEYSKLPIIIKENNDFFYQLRETADGILYYELKESKGFADLKGNKFKEYYNETIVKNRKRITPIGKDLIKKFKDENDANVDYLFKRAEFKGFNIDSLLFNEDTSKKTEETNEEIPFEDDSNC